MEDFSFLKAVKSSGCHFTKISSIDFSSTPSIPGNINQDYFNLLININNERTKKQFEIIWDMRSYEIIHIVTKFH